MTGKTPNDRTTQQIDENLRRVFRQVEEEAVPDRFTELLNQLRQKEADGDKGPSE